MLIFSTAVPQLQIPESIEQHNTKQNVSRPCSFCGMMQSNLIRHLKTVHKEEDEVKQGNNAPTKSERDQIFDRIRKSEFTKTIRNC